MQTSMATIIGTARGEYIGRIYTQSKNRPLYIVQDVVGARLGRATLGIDASVAEGPVAVEPEGRQRG